ncbi:MAG: hypothetical protein GXO32_07215 [Crenarchaeota archaeon]|nr:hypothetical protein [Thermoproteota archaeon]
MPRIVLVPFASPLHGREYYVGLLDLLKKNLEGHDVHVAEVVESVEQAAEVGKKYRDAFPIAVALTGGTSRAIRRFVEAGAFDRMIIFAHGEHNSLPSAISARAKLEAEGMYVWLYHCPTLHDQSCRLVIDEMMSVSYAVANILSARFALVGVEEKSDEVSDFENSFGVEVEIVPMDEFADMISSASDDDVRKFVDDISARLGVERSENLESVGRVYAALKKLFVERKLVGVGIDCFRYIVEKGVAPCLAVAKLNEEGFVTACEADVKSLLLMSLSYFLTGSSGWMANASMFRGRKAWFAHCTASLSLLRNAKALTHFESGKPYAVTGELSSDVFTIASVSSDFSLMAVALGRVEASGLLSIAMCRTAAVVDLGIDAEKIPLVAPANHHVFMPGDVRKKLRAVAELLGIEYAEYRELVEVV